MTEASEREPQPPTEREPRNPTSDELDVEGPNESAPGHEPAGDEGDEAAELPPRTAD